MRFESAPVPIAIDESGPNGATDIEERADVDRVRAGDKAAFERLYRAYYRRLVGFVYLYVHAEPIAEEVVQDVFLAIWRERARWELRTTVRAYLFQAARNTAFNHLRHQGVSRSVVDGAVADGRALAMGEGPPALDAQQEADELARAALAAIGRLPARCRMTYTLCRGHGLSYGETAQVMGISEHTVKVQMARALQALRTELAHWLS